MPMFPNKDKLIDKGIENLMVAVVLEVGFQASGHCDKNEYLNDLYSNDDSWHDEYEAWQESYYAEENVNHYHDYLGHI